MAREKKMVSRLQATGEKRLAGIRSISPTLDLGDGKTAAAYEKQVNAVKVAIAEYNQTLSTVDAQHNRIVAAVKLLGDWNERMLAGVASKFGKDSDEYEKAGGVRKSERKRSTRKPKA